MKVVLVMFKGADRRDFPLTADRTVVGRKADSQLRIPTKDVSRQHCEVVIDKVGALVRDLGSSNGTYVNGKRVAESPLNAGDTLTVGPVNFIVQVNGQPSRITPHDIRKPEPTRPVAAPPAADKKKGADLPPGLMPDDNDDSDMLTLDDLDLNLIDDDDETKTRKQ